MFFKQILIYVMHWHEFHFHLQIIKWSFFHIMIIYLNSLLLIIVLLVQKCPGNLFSLCSKRQCVTCMSISAWHLKSSKVWIFTLNLSSYAQILLFWWKSVVKLIYFINLIENFSNVSVWHFRKNIILRQKKVGAYTLCFLLSISMYLWGCKIKIWIKWISSKATDGCHALTYCTILTRYPLLYSDPPEIGSKNTCGTY